MATSSRLLFVDHAVVFLIALADKDGLKWRRSVAQLLNEMARNPASDSAIRRGIPRGNRQMWGEIVLHRLGMRKAYRECDLVEWYENHAKPILEAEDAIVKAGSLVRISSKRARAVIKANP